MMARVSFVVPDITGMEEAEREAYLAAIAAANPPSVDPVACPPLAATVLINPPQLIEGSLHPKLEKIEKITELASEIVEKYISKKDISKIVTLRDWNDDPVAVPCPPVLPAPIDICVPNSLQPDAIMAALVQGEDEELLKKSIGLISESNMMQLDRVEDHFKVGVRQAKRQEIQRSLTLMCKIPRYSFESSRYYSRT
jgi:hypothetical protein